MDAKLRSSYLGFRFAINAAELQVTEAGRLSLLLAWINRAVDLNGVSILVDGN